MEFFVSSHLQKLNKNYPDKSKAGIIMLMSGSKERALRRQQTLRQPIQLAKASSLPLAEKSAWCNYRCEVCSGGGRTRGLTCGGAWISSENVNKSQLWAWVTGVDRRRGQRVETRSGGAEMWGGRHIRTTVIADGGESFLTKMLHNSEIILLKWLSSYFGTLKKCFQPCDWLREAFFFFLASRRGSSFLFFFFLWHPHRLTEPARQLFGELSPVGHFSLG